MFIFWLYIANIIGLIIHRFIVSKNVIKLCNENEHIDMTHMPKDFSKIVTWAFIAEAIIRGVLFPIHFVCYLCECDILGAYRINYLCTNTQLRVGFDVPYMGRVYDGQYKFPIMD